MSEPRPGGRTAELDRPGPPEAQRTKAPWYRGRIVRSLSWTTGFGFIAYAAMRLYGLETGWAPVAMVSFTPYVAVAALVGAGLQALVRHWRAAAVTAAMALALSAAVVPRAVADPQPAAAGESLTVLSVNLYVGEANLRHVVDLVDEHDPDLLSVQETTAPAIDRLAELGLTERLPHAITTTGRAAEGTSLYSRHPLERLEELEPDGIFHQIAAEVSLPDRSTVRFLAVHTAAPYAPHRIPEWEQDFAELPRPDGDDRWILAGDFNATLDHHAMRELLESGYTDAADATGRGLTATWRPVRGYLRGLVRPPGVALDHVLVEQDAAVLDFQVLDKDGSDHAPVLATVRMP
ncbi:endonuclease/exonuclease/phosphatase family protein [Glycomyces xiaoerkulensis]|uniref:endonuclease/exonuclease/phosphatase family protein n=1 Tax=Glycomyces xiaoerkulensis TaxID=2038139 RepID=UPI000C26610A|nr:endonuclease/exonuclease/phosphatase family protein [Glycomyces xiaoerkulensis]